VTPRKYEDLSQDQRAEHDKGAPKSEALREKAERLQPILARAERLGIKLDPKEVGLSGARFEAVREEAKRENEIRDIVNNEVKRDLIAILNSDGLIAEGRLPKGEAESIIYPKEGQDPEIGKRIAQKIYSILEPFSSKEERSLLVFDQFDRGSEHVSAHRLNFLRSKPYWVIIKDKEEGKEEGFEGRPREGIEWEIEK